MHLTDAQIRQMAAESPGVIAERRLAHARRHVNTVIVHLLIFCGGLTLLWLFFALVAAVSGR